MKNRKIKEKRTIRKRYTDENGNIKEYGYEYTNDGVEEFYEEFGTPPEELRYLKPIERIKMMEGENKHGEILGDMFGNIFNKLPFEKRPKLPQIENKQEPQDSSHPYDIQKDKGSVYVTIEVPGMTKKDLYLTKENNVLNVKSNENTPKDINMSIDIPYSIDTSYPIDAKVTNGILEIKLLCLENKKEDIKIK